MNDAAGGPLGRNFFGRPTVTVARDLIGCRIVMDDGAVVCTIVETEAYLGTDDAASHAWRGPTPRAGIMFGDPGILYVYVSYGIHHCMNITTERAGVAGAVLLRAAEVVTGEEIVQRRRTAARWLSHPLSGPGNLCRGLAVTGADRGMDVCASGARMAVHPRIGVPEIVVSPRIGITRNVGAPLRFHCAGNAAVSVRRSPSSRTAGAVG